MNMKQNTIPANVETIHFTAVCGTGMAALASMIKDLGYEVTGSDQNVYPPMSDFLAGKGITVTSGYRAENLSHRPGLLRLAPGVRPPGRPTGLKVKKGNA